MQEKDKHSEMSLDEVLSSIKKMVTDDDPPVMDLTDMISSDGSIVKVKKGENDLDAHTQSSTTSIHHDTEAGSFLRLVQENTHHIPNTKSAVEDDYKHQKPIRKTPPLSPQQISENIFTPRSNKGVISKDNVLREMVKEMMLPMLQEWLIENMPAIASDLAAKEIKNLFLNKSSDKPE